MSVTCAGVGTHDTVALPLHGVEDTLCVSTDGTTHTVFVIDGFATKTKLFRPSSSIATGMPLDERCRRGWFLFSSSSPSLVLSLLLHFSCQPALCTFQLPFLNIN